MIRYNINRIVGVCAIVLLLIFIILNHTPDTPQIIELETTYVPPTTLFSPPKTSRASKPPSQPKKPQSGAKKFFVFSPRCKIPYVDPFKSELVDVMSEVPLKVCSMDQDLFSVLYDRKARHYTLRVNQDFVKTKYADSSDLHCVYREVIPGSNDSFAMTNSPQVFEEYFVVPRHFLGVVVQCNEMKNLSQVVQVDAFSFAQYPEDRNETSDDWRGAHYPSVFLFGIDSMSRINYRRTMPLTSQFTSQQGWYEMEGYNKVGDNTLPNLLAVLTGRSTKEWSRNCNLKHPGCFDFVTYLWDHFHNAGYLTAYAEDLPAISTFNYLKSGFTRKPVDFYLRPFLMILDHVLETVDWFDQKYCVGRRTSFSYVFDYAKQLIQRFVKETSKPLFGLFWTSSCTHDHPRGGELLDGIFVKYLEQFKEYGLFDKAIVVLFSDHGSRYGELAEVSSGFLEERLPMLHIYLPPHYRRRYPEVARALQLNKNRLTSAYDLHMGIRSILKPIRPALESRSVPPDGMETFQLQFITSPNGGKFRSVINSDPTGTYVDIELEGISRLNSYRNESQCVEDVLAKKICVCRKKKSNGSSIVDESSKVRKVKYSWIADQEDEYDDSNDHVVGKIRIYQ
ncbi:GL22688 [Drosophila persimilis]|uniref:GL22688 n=1 Tax=Drosophila persimilis TaxID=7234 RepID=B4GZZ9_DROPE|nr:GL22688 [Drosophila persimilis]